MKCVVRRQLVNSHAHERVRAKGLCSGCTSVCALNLHMHSPRPPLAPAVTARTFKNSSLCTNSPHALVVTLPPQHPHVVVNALSLICYKLSSQLMGSFVGFLWDFVFRRAIAYSQMYPKGADGASRKLADTNTGAGTSRTRLASIAEEHDGMDACAEEEDLANNMAEPLANKFTPGVQAYLRAQLQGRQIKVRNKLPEKRIKQVPTPYFISIIVYLFFQ